MHISIIVPAFNEEETIEGVVRALREIKGFEKEILVIDDGSSDKTAYLAERAGADKVIRHRHNRGYGASLKTGVQHARYDVILTFDADLQHDPADVPKLLEHLDNDTDMVAGDRSGSEPFSHRSLGKRLLRTVAEFLTEEDIPDINCGLRLFRKEKLLSVLPLLPDGFSFSTTSTLAFLKNDYGTKFVPINHTPRRGGASQLNLVTDGINTLTLIFRLITIFDPMKVFLPASVFLFVAGLIYGLFMILVTFNIPDGAVLLMVVGILLFFFGLLAEQISELRRHLKK